MNTLGSAQAVPELVWVKSSYSAGNGGDCVEVARTDTLVHVRDSKRAAGAAIAVGSAEWTTFLRLAAGRD
ncbi:MULTISPECIES: DUF397 domain-containing protein [Streptomyces]|uniref:DUF397 domain-containing protein n=1 Tax=Streptomyces TaxID=1883 RepID=UPI00056062F9|nr:MULTISPECIES: DUF397 domain-containing protein [Streptomyces anthocyanicus group]WSB61082.1 DUF397 domain-containing protein [Streptomyces anthocyanicus]